MHYMQSCSGSRCCPGLRYSHWDSGTKLLLVNDQKLQTDCGGILVLLAAILCLAALVMMQCLIP